MDLARHIKWIKPPVFLLCLVPAARLTWEGFHDGLGPNPIETITHSTGTWTLTFICVTLTVTPLRKLLHQNVLVRFRRMFGLFAFFYGSLHLMTYVWLDKVFNFQDMIKDVYKRPVHHCRVHGISADGAAGGDFDQRNECGVWAGGAGGTCIA